MSEVAPAFGPGGTPGTEFLPDDLDPADAAEYVELARLVLNAALYSVTSLAGLDAPWSRLASRLVGLEVRPMLAGGVYVARGRYEAPASDQTGGVPSSPARAPRRSSPAGV